MARRRLKEYLEDPSLLQTISEEEMRAWAAEVPYAGLVQRLLAQKLAMEKASQDEQDRANILAILSNANPHKTIRSLEDFKKMMLGLNNNSGSDWADVNLEIEPEILSGQQESDLTDESVDSDQDMVEVQEDIDNEDGLSDEASVTETSSPDIDVDNQLLLVRQEDEIGIDEGPGDDHEAQTDLPLVGAEDPTLENSEQNEAAFTAWLEGLKSLENESETEEDLELENKELASDALAQLLVSQGHVEKAIEMYRVLMLKNPQKSSFFAAQIEKLQRP